MSRTSALTGIQLCLQFSPQHNVLFILKKNDSSLQKTLNILTETELLFFKLKNFVLGKQISLPSSAWLDLVNLFCWCQGVPPAGEGFF